MSAQGWRTLAASVAGTSHLFTGQPCADACAVRTLEGAGGAPLLVAVAADGAGSSARAPEGARLACDEILRMARDWVSVEPDLSAFGQVHVGAWVDTASLRIRGQAFEEGLEARDFACTLLVALVDDTRGVFFQVGDGAIVYRNGADTFAPALWPQTGEYANTTWFVTDEDAAERAQATAFDGVHEVALFTDGLQGLALRFVSREVHSPFFEPMFEQLRRANGETDSLEEELLCFLESDAVNARTDDDKTLVLATRRGSGR